MRRKIERSQLFAGNVPVTFWPSETDSVDRRQGTERVMLPHIFHADTAVVYIGKPSGCWPLRARPPSTHCCVAFGAFGTFFGL